MEKKGINANEHSEGSWDSSTKVTFKLQDLATIIRREARRAILSQGFTEQIAKQQGLNPADMQNQTETDTGFVKLKELQEIVDKLISHNVVYESLERHHRHIRTEMRRRETEISNLIAQLEAKVRMLSKELDSMEQQMLEARQEPVRAEVIRILRELGVTPCQPSYQHELEPADMARGLAAVENKAEVQPRRHNENCSIETDLVFKKNQSQNSSLSTASSDTSESKQLRLTVEWHKPMRGRRASRSCDPVPTTSRMFEADTTHNQRWRQRTKYSCYHHAEYSRKQYELYEE